MGRAIFFRKSKIVLILTKSNISVYCNFCIFTSYSELTQNNEKGKVIVCTHKNAYCLEAYR